MPQKNRILIVEDEEGLAIHLAFLLKRMKYVPLEPVAYGEKAVEVAGSQRPDLVLMDVYLAGEMDGIVAARQIRDRFDIPVIFLSAITEDGTVENAQTSEPYGYLVKPVSESELRIAIEMAFYKHRMETRLRESEERYRSLFEKLTNSFGVGEILCDETGVPVDFSFVTVNSAFLKMIGRTEQQVVGNKMSEVLPQFLTPDLLQTFGFVALQGESVNFEFHPIEDVYFNVVAYSIRPGQFAASVEDVTARRLAEQSLKESEVRFRQLAEGVREVFWLLQRETGQLLYISPAYERIFQCPVQVVYENPSLLLGQIHPDEQKRVAEAERNLYEEGKPFDQEFRIQLADGSQRWIWARIFPVVEEMNQVVRYSGIAEDITERRESEERLRESYRSLQSGYHRMSTLLNVDLAITTQTDQSLLTQAILSQVADSGEIDAAVLFVPNNPPAGRSRSTGPLGQLRLAGMAGISETILDSSVLGWQMVMANYAYQTNQSYFIENLCEDSHPGAQALHRVGGFMTSAILPLMDHGDVKGVLQFFNRKQFSPDSDWKTFFQSLALQTAIGLDRVEMLENLKRSNRELAMAYEETVKGWGQALELRDQETRGHTERVTRLTQRLAESMGIREPDLTNIRLGALLHDVGKMAIPDSILRNTGPLNQDQWVTMRQHTTIAYNMLYNIEYLRPALEVVYSHHEKWDGSGYPRGLKEEEIPLSARIFAVVDVWDALTTDRPYRLAWPLQEAREYIRQQSGKHFDPRVVEYFLKLV